MSDHQVHIDTAWQQYAVKGMSKIHSKQAYSWQIDAIMQIMNMAAYKDMTLMSPCLLIWSTGGGKSAIRDVIGNCLGGIALTIVPLLSLGADQTTKLKFAVEHNNLPFEVHHLNEYYSYKANDNLCWDILHWMQENDDDPVFLFCSPQKIANSREWQSFIKQLIDADYL